MSGRLCLDRKSTRLNSSHELHDALPICYGGGLSDQSTICSQTPALAAFINAHPELTVDVGQVMFGETTSMTGDGPLGHYLHRVTGRRWFSGDVELEGGCGIVPITYRDRSFVHSMDDRAGVVSAG